MDCCALLDDATGASRLYTGFVRALSCADGHGLPVLLDEMDTALRDGLHAVAAFEYELGHALHGLPSPAARPLGQILLFRDCARLSADEVTAWLGTGTAGIAGIRASIDQAAFDAALAAIHAYIEAGDTYQVNYTYRLRFDAYGTPAALYARLRERQPVPYGALVVLPDGRAILSLSPELFVRHDAGVLTARPMKGTAPAADDDTENAARAAALAADPKNRAENLMIVDLLRNDLGRIARAGSVRVPSLFDVQRYARVLQMTSTVQAELRAGATLAEVLPALYPCGSITGAPKRRTMEIIAELEAAPRGFYTGALGWFEAPRGAHAVGDFCLSVPIRTLTLQPETTGMRRGEMGVGAGIVYDSDSAEEYAECALKARFLTGLAPDFQLFETIYATREAGCRHQEAHLDRMQASAAYFGFPFTRAALQAGLRAACAELADGAHRLRLALGPDGTWTIQSGALAPLREPVRVLLAPDATRANDLFLRHKTSVRTRYDAAWRAAEAQGAFDMLFFNERGELTEGGRSNVFVRLDGSWYTPPLACGLLPGVMRAALMGERHTLERVLTREDLRAAQEVLVCNALRGAVVAQVEGV
jgi:para-aminobenzoate synthetase/4-amino-4-deoxychorismate lyase